jgi:hypothetical protein
MTAQEIINKLTRLIEINKNFADQDVELVVQKNVYGGTPTVGISTVQTGIDFDHGKILMYPQKKVTEIE